MAWVTMIPVQLVGLQISAWLNAKVVNGFDVRHLTRKIAGLSLSDCNTTVSTNVLKLL